MFTGIIEKTLRVQAVADSRGFRRLTLAANWNDVKRGESVAINGACLTVAEMGPGVLTFDLISETLDKTNLSALLAGDHVNVERSLKVGDRIDGHFVQGHVDGLAKLTNVTSDEDGRRLTVEAPHHLAKYLVPKGSVTIDGVSLTIASLNDSRFEVALIPTTLSLTTLGQKQAGWLFNFEADVFSKTIISFLERRESTVR